MFKPHIWESSDSLVIIQNALKKGDCRTLKSAISQEKNDEST